MKWNEVTRLEVKGNTLTVKDAMIMLGEDESSPQTPSVKVDPGEFIFEINVPQPFHAHRARIRRLDSKPKPGKEIGSVEVDNAFISFIDYEPFLKAVQQDYEEYGEWTAGELDDELAINFSGEIPYKDEKLLYVKSGDGDGTYQCFELVQDGAQVGIECVFIPQDGE